MMRSAEPTVFDLTTASLGQTWEMSWGRIKVHSISSLEVWEHDVGEHYLVAFNPQHRHLIDIVSPPEDKGNQGVIS